MICVGDRRQRLDQYIAWPTACGHFIAMHHAANGAADATGSMRLAARLRSIFANNAAYATTARMMDSPSVGQANISAMSGTAAPQIQMLRVSRTQCRSGGAPCNAAPSAYAWPERTDLFHQWRNEC